METQNLKSREALSSFIRYCVTHPEFRFWQALKNWSGYARISAVEIHRNPEPVPNPLMVSGYSESHYDTYNWEGLEKLKNEESKSSS